MKAWTKREKVFAVALAAMFLMGAATVTRSVDFMNVTPLGGLFGVSHISSVLHVSAASPIPIVVSPQSTLIVSSAHVATVNHISSVTHVAINSYGSDPTVSATLSSLGATSGFGNLTDAGVSTVQVAVSSISAGISLVFETSNDASTTFLTRAGLDQNGVPVMNITANGVYVFPTGGAQATRTRVIDFTSGSVVVRSRGIRGGWTPPVYHQGASSKTGFYCHSQANFVTSAPESIIAHAGNSQRLYICGYSLTPTQDEQVVLVEGTTAGCKTGTLGVWPGPSAPHLAAVWHVSALPIMESVHPTSWLSTQTAGNPLCVHKLNATSRVSGIVIYGAYPDGTGR